jgi:hypothetical protein
MIGLLSPRFRLPATSLRDLCPGDEEPDAF